jgi:hypothetical protein
MSSLLSLQRGLRDHALDRQQPKAGLIASLKDDRPIPARQRLAIYRNNTRLSLISTLSDSFPVVARLVGEDYFAHLAGDFIRSSPPRHPALLDYGGEFPGFISQHEVHWQLPYLADVARLEAAWQHAYHAPEAKPIAPELLYAFGEEVIADVRLRVHPSHRFVASTYPIDAIWRSNQPGAEGETIDWRSGGVNLLVYRPDAEVTILPVDTPSFAFLMALATSQTFTTAWEAALGIDRNFQLVPALTQFLASGLFVGVLPP